MAEAVSKVDAERFFYRSLFAEMGFEGEELEFRTHAFFAYHAGKNTIFDLKAAGDLSARLKWPEGFFCNPFLLGDVCVQANDEAPA